MQYPVLCFDRDQTIDLNPAPDMEPVPLSWVQFYAHNTQLHVWATGNQQLQIEAGIPTPYEARQLMIDNDHSVDDVPGGGDRYREDRLSIIDTLYNLVGDEPTFIVVDDARLNNFCERNRGWSWYKSEGFVKNIDSMEIPDPDPDMVSGEPYYNTEKHGTYNEMLDTLHEKLK